jgi:hypothetical protein
VQRLVFPWPWFRAWLFELAEDGGGSWRLRVGRRRHAEGCDWLVRGVAAADIWAASACIEVWPATAPSNPASAAVGRLVYRLGPDRPRLRGWVHGERGEKEALAALFLAGPGMHEIPLVEIADD